MYKKITRTPTSISVNTSTEGETIEQQITRLINNGAPVDSEKIPLYTKPSDGIPYGTDIRGDKWEQAIETNEKINTNIDNIRKAKLKIVTDEKNGENEGGQPQEQKEE